MGPGCGNAFWKKGWSLAVHRSSSCGDAARSGSMAPFTINPCAAIRLLLAHLPWPRNNIRLCPLSCFLVITLSSLPFPSLARHSLSSYFSIPACIAEQTRQKNSAALITVLLIFSQPLFLLQVSNNLRKATRNFVFQNLMESLSRCPKES